MADDVPPSSSASPHDHSNIDPAIGGPAGPGMMGNSNASGDDDGMGGKGGKRELSQSKRAAQNRAAQRAFRQRKEGYIKKLEEQVRELHALEENYKSIQSENYSLREYIIHLQSRLIESQGEYPQPPPNVNLSHPATTRHDAPMQDPRSTVGSAHAPPPAAPHAPMSSHQASAAARLAANVLNAGTGKPFISKEPEDPDEEISRQLRADGLPTTMSM
ncbi:hypothetical protein BP5796_10394 [Coleophoma crateriformis]|uniref:Putative transcription factor kapC n=1 Tax=Coleophoma crateriformis TaxID=565419 RepID=A0A3D8QQ23_9HELO|nr:hypothetical protein BP5796_10394 [Coleophoma crateriformis]